MNKTIKGTIPIITGLISIIFIAVYYYMELTLPHDHHKEDAAGELFKLLGNGAIIAGTISFSWYLLKKKLKSPFALVKTVAKKAYRYHTNIGWIVLGLVAVHGGYFLITDFSNHDNLTGASAFILLLCLAGYGYFLNKSKKKKKALRSAHFALSIMWIAAILIHGGGFVIACGTMLAALYAGVTWYERRSEKRMKHKYQ